MNHENEEKVAMKPITRAAVLLLAILLVAPHHATAQTAKQAFAKGKALLAAADFQGAMQAFARAAQADLANQEYLQHFAIVRRVVALREMLDTETDDTRWEYIARGLYKFYSSHELKGESLALAGKMHDRLRSASSAKMLADAQLDSDMNAEAAATLASLPASQQTAATRALRGVALAREGHVDEARQIAGSLTLTEDVGPGQVYAAARLSAAVGNHKDATKLLSRSFESVAPSLLPAFKQQAQKCPEFAGLVSKPAFAQALQTESKVPESKCSGGSRCSSCPMRAKCSKSQTE
jgi:hypothetical protein